MREIYVKSFGTRVREFPGVADVRAGRIRDGQRNIPQPDIQDLIRDYAGRVALCAGRSIAIERRWQIDDGCHRRPSYGSDCNKADRKSRQVNIQIFDPEKDSRRTVKAGCRTRWQSLFLPGREPLILQNRSEAVGIENSLRSIS